MIIFIYFLLPFFFKNNYNNCSCCYNNRSNETISEYEATNFLISSENQRPSENFE